MRLRIRINEDTGQRLAELRPALRAQVAATVLESHALGIDLAELLEMRRELSRLGTLINQSLRVSKGMHTDTASLEEVRKIITSLVRK